MNGHTEKQVYEEDMTALLIMPSDFPYAAVLEVAAMLEEGQLLVPGYIPPAAGIYNPASYIFEERLSGTEFLILPDRNLASRMARIAMGESIDSERRLAAALMAFAQCLNLNFEPSVAFHELAHRHGNAIAHEELRWFRSADAARPQDWIDIALARRDRLSPPSDAPAVVERDLALPLRRWNRNYVLALKVAELELDAAPAKQKILRLLDWMYSDFIVAGPAFLFATLYLAPSAPRKRMLKQLRSPDRARAVDGVRNAAWDITHMSDFVRRVQEEGSDCKRFILATADKGLSRSASALFHYADERDGPGTLAARLSAWWRARDAQTIADVFLAYVDRLNDPTRQSKSDATLGYVERLIHTGEQRLFEWHPNG